MTTETPAEEQVQTEPKSTILPPSKRRWQDSPFWHNFARSIYITTAWDWFMMLVGKAAEAVLTITVIYACAKMLPEVHTPAAVDNFIFVVQMVALDLGGLSLRKLANQARKDGNKEGARLAGNVSTALISIMIANVVLSVARSIYPVPDQVIAMLEGILLIARAVMAVIYAHVIHSLRDDHSPEDQHGETEMAQPAVDIQALLMEALNGLETKLTASQEQALVTLERHLQEQMKTWHNQQGTGTSEETLEEGAGAPVSRPELKIVPFPRRETGKRNAQSLIFALLDEDGERGPRELARLSGVPLSTSKRHRDAWLTKRNSQTEAPVQPASC